ncbi:porin family protein [Flavobacterium rhizosphaerae]|uniref:Outer membrane beta-barrel protein n=1 Tax=Flavobacterium rhizosphaerae TaxID=3163298 RepID=A0ABW8YVG0_9FLAO
MKKTLLALVLLSVLHCFSQTHYEQGYFINNQNATTQCLIKNIAWKNNPESFEYKLTEAGEVQKAHINDVKEFNVNNTYKFIRYSIDIDRAPNDVNHLSVIKEPDWKKETVFLKALVEGKITLYQYEDGNLVRYFYITETMEVPEQLIYKPYKTGSAVAYNTAYKGQLYNVMKDKLQDIKSFKNIKYNKESLVKLFLEYNGNAETQVNNLSSRQNKSSFHVKFAPGISFVSSSVYQSSNTNAGIDMDTKPVLRIGAEAELLLPFNNNKWSLFVDPNYQAYKGEKKGTKGVNYVTPDWELKYQFLELPVGARYYMYLNNKSKFFIDIAYVFSFNMGDSYVQYTFPERVGSTGYSLKNDNITKTTNFAAGLGFSYSDFSIEARYGFERGILHNYDNFGAEYSSLNIIIGYKIF